MDVDGDGDNANRMEEDELQKEETNRKFSSLRSMDADLKVIVGGECGEGDEQVESKVYWHYSPTLASQSGYVDALLSTPLRTNVGGSSSDHREIAFPDISPSQWERMIQFITDPLVFQSITVEDALELAGPYDQYEFHTGIKVCDEVLSKKALFGVVWSDFEKIYDREKINAICFDIDYLDQCVDAIVVSHTANLKKTLHRGKLWLKFIFDELELIKYMSLTANHIKQLVPVIISDSEITELFDYFQHDDDENDDDYDFDTERRIGLQAAMMAMLSTEDPVDFKNPMFPQLFVTTIELNAAKSAACKIIKYIGVVFTDISDPLAGIYSLEFYPRYVQDNVIEAAGMLTKGEGAEWTIKHHNYVVYVCKGSRLSVLPPKTGWKAVDENQREVSDPEIDIPVLEYYLEK